MKALPNYRTFTQFVTDYNVREEGGDKFIEGYFAVFNKNYEIWKDVTESVAPGAFAKCLNDDVRALTNHDTTLVLGRTAATTLVLREDDFGLWGKILINPNDTDALNTYERVKRGDVSQCSFGFEILEEETENREDGSVHYTIKAVKLYEVSVCTFPAYEDTNVKARGRDLKAIKARQLEAWKAMQKKKLRGI